MAGTTRGNGATTGTGAARDDRQHRDRHDRHHGEGDDGTHQHPRGPHDHDASAATTRAARAQRLGRRSGSKGRLRRPDDSGSTAQPAAQPGNVRKVAQTVCNSFLPKQIEQEPQKGKRKPEDVARDYSRGFPNKQQKRRLRGCLAGLKARG